jgi:hypothetical protein
MAQPRGFSRALKRGLYGKRLSEPQIQGLRGMPPNAYHQEQAAIRITIDRLLERINQPGVSNEELAALSVALVRLVGGGMISLARLLGETERRSPEDLLEQILGSMDPYPEEPVEVRALPGRTQLTSQAIQLPLLLPLRDSVDEEPRS